MNVSSQSSTLQTLLGQINGVNPVAPKPPVRAAAPQQQQAAAVPAQKAPPANKPPLNPNAPRGTYLNLVV